MYRKYWFNWSGVQKQKFIWLPFMFFFCLGDVYIQLLFSPQPALKLPWALGLKSVYISRADILSSKSRGRTVMIKLLEPLYLAGTLLWPDMGGEGFFPPTRGKCGWCLLHKYKARFQTFFGIFEKIAITKFSQIFFFRFLAVPFSTKRNLIYLLSQCTVL